MVVEGSDTLFLSFLGLVLAPRHLIPHLETETTLFGSLILRAQAFLGMSQGIGMLLLKRGR